MRVELKDIDPGLRWQAILGWMIFPPWAWYLKLLARLTTKRRGSVCKIAGVRREVISIPRRSDGSLIRVCIYRPAEPRAAELPGLLYLHPGGYLIGNPEISEPQIGAFMASRDCVVVAPDYRKSIEAPYPAAIDDCYDALLWMKANAADIGIRDDQLMVGGHSAGGGLTAAVALRARDRGEVRIAFQMPIYPMIDDRMESASAQSNNGPLWGSRHNRLGWDFYLQGLVESGQEITADAAPARATDYRGLPPALTYVGDLEPFRDETIAYVENLTRAGVPIEFRIFKGCFHGFDVLAPKASVSQAACEFATSGFARAVDSCFAQQN